MSSLSGSVQGRARTCPTPFPYSHSYKSAHTHLLSYVQQLKDTFCDCKRILHAELEKKDKVQDVKNYIPLLVSYKNIHLTCKYCIQKYSECRKRTNIIQNIRYENIWLKRLICVTIIIWHKISETWRHYIRSRSLASRYSHVNKWAFSVEYVNHRL